LSPAQLISACEHLAACASCRYQVSGDEQLQRAFDALGPSLHQAAASESMHLTGPELSAYAAGRMDVTDVEVADSHLEICAECAGHASRLIETTAAHVPNWRAARRWTRLVSQLREHRAQILIQGAAALVLLLLGISTLILRGDLQRLRAQVRALEQENGDLRNQLPAINDLQAQIEKLRDSQLSSSSSELAVALKDAGAIVGLNKQGKIIGFDALPPAQETLLKTALTSGRLALPRNLADLVAGDDTMMGPAERDSFRLLSPVGTVTRTDRPTFRWTPLEGAASYRIRVSDSRFKPVATSEPVSGSDWTISRPLKRGALYSWEVTAIKDGKEITAPTPPAREASFRVLDSAKVDELEGASRDHANSHLLLGVLYVNAGLLDDAEREFRALANANPQSDVARKLMRVVKSLRSPKQKQTR
jgi:cell division protein FtsB